mgnify:FL=1
MNATALLAAALVFSFPQDKQDFKAWLSAGGWESKREDPAGWEVGGGELHLVSRDNSALIAAERGFPRDAGRMKLRLKVASTPRGTNLARKAGDDAAFRVYVAFAKGGGVFSPPHTLAYTWAESGAAGTLTQSAHFSNLKYLTIGSGATGWVDVEVDLAADYRRAFPGEPLPKLKGIALKCASNDTGTSAEAWLSSLAFL